MRLIQLQIPGSGRRVGLVNGDTFIDLTELNPEWTHIYKIFPEARKAGKTLEQHISDSNTRSDAAVLSYTDLLSNRLGDDGGWALPPIDHPDPAHCIITGTGLTHLGSTSQRDNMHKVENQSKTDS